MACRTSVRQSSSVICASSQAPRCFSEEQPLNSRRSPVRMLDFHLTWSLVAGDQDVRKCLHSQLGSDTVAATAGCQVLLSQALGGSAQHCCASGAQFLCCPNPTNSAILAPQN